MTRAKRSSRGWVAVLVCAAAASSCGGSGGGGGGSCGTVSPCGGDPTGTWRYTATCSKAVMDLSAAGCPNAEVVPGGLVASGTVAFNADQTYALSLTQTGTVKVNVPATCLMQGAFTLTCAEAAQLIQAQLGADSEFTSVTCTGTNGCSCAFGASLVSEQSGTWSAADKTLIFNGASGETAADGFCVQGRELHIMDVDQTMTMGTMGEAKITSDIVAVKQ